MFTVKKLMFAPRLTHQAAEPAVLILYQVHSDWDSGRGNLLPEAEKDGLKRF